GHLSPGPAWAESWASYFASVVLNAPVLTDMGANQDGTGLRYYAVNLEDCDFYDDFGNATNYTEAGAAVEISVIGTIWDLVDAVDDNGGTSTCGDNLTDGFEYTWGTVENGVVWGGWGVFFFHYDYLFMPPHPAFSQARIASVDEVFCEH